MVRRRWIVGIARSIAQRATAAPAACHPETGADFSRLVEQSGPGTGREQPREMIVGDSEELGRVSEVVSGG
jgi:hypothetical protein